MILMEWYKDFESQHQIKGSFNPRFELSWASHTEVKHIVTNSWGSNVSNNFLPFDQKLRSVLRCLKLWDFQRNQGSIRGAIGRKEEKIERLESDDNITSVSMDSG